jgi:hypothetical protein
MWYESGPKHLHMRTGLRREACREQEREGGREGGRGRGRGRGHLNALPQAWHPISQKASPTVIALKRVCERLEVRYMITQLQWGQTGQLLYCTVSIKPPPV